MDKLIHFKKKTQPTNSQLICKGIAIQHDILFFLAILPLFFPFIFDFPLPPNVLSVVFPFMPRFLPPNPYFVYLHNLMFNNNLKFKYLVRFFFLSPPSSFFLFFFPLSVSKKSKSFLKPFLNFLIFSLSSRFCLCFSCIAATCFSLANFFSCLIRRTFSVCSRAVFLCKSACRTFCICSSDLNISAK
ncbi:hypothetical protein AGLY_009468 [Aphis glycines]|uniref:Uncharacterized protein n=1 Tax=Aphis glycines TaxID=307491 RepID=A0A6G0TJS2_APHGL|nr:hypothetical protein AGLY_009468 [Aphis glycines]